jgi:hypothetical protein
MHGVRTAPSPRRTGGPEKREPVAMYPMVYRSVPLRSVSIATRADEVA